MTKLWPEWDSLWKIKLSVNMVLITHWKHRFLPGLKQISRYTSCCWDVVSLKLMSCAIVLYCRPKTNMCSGYLQKRQIWRFSQGRYVTRKAGVKRFVCSEVIVVHVPCWWTAPFSVYAQRWGFGLIQSATSFSDIFLATKFSKTRPEDCSCIAT